MCNKQSLLLGIYCFLLLSLSQSIWTSGHAASTDQLALTDNALSFVRNIVGIGVETYNVTNDCKGPIDSFLYPGHTETVVNLGLTAATGQFEIEVDFIDNYLVSYRLTSESGQPVLNLDNPSNALEAAKGVLIRYQRILNATYVSQLVSMIDGIPSLDQQKTLDSGLAILNCNPYAGLAGSISLTWSCKNASRKMLGMSISKQGYLDWLKDMWGISKMSHSEIKILKQTALQMASDEATAYAKQIGAKIMTANVSFQYINSYPEARGGDPLVLYPSWDIEFTFDKVYANSVSGYFVGIWADTGEIRTATPEGFFGQSPQPTGNNDNGFLEVGVIVLATSVVVGAAILTVHKKQKHHKAR